MPRSLRDPRPELRGHNTEFPPVHTFKSGAGLSNAPALRPEGKAFVRPRPFAKPIGAMTSQSIEKAAPPGDLP